MTGQKTERRETTRFVGYHLPLDMIKDVKRVAVELGITGSDYVKLALTERLTKDVKLFRRPPSP